MPDRKPSDDALQAALNNLSDAFDCDIESNGADTRMRVRTIRDYINDGIRKRGYGAQRQEMLYVKPLSIAIAVLVTGVLTWLLSTAHLLVGAPKP